MTRFWFLLACSMGFAASVFASGNDRIVSVIRADPRTGKLVRTVVKPARVAKPDPRETGTEAPANTGIAKAVDQIAAQHELPPQLIHSVIKVESNYNPYAVSPKGALGLMQLIPATARRFGVADVFDPVENIRGGARYLKYLLNLYAGNYTLALAAYNAGEGAVARYGDVPPFAETQNYVKQVSARLSSSLGPSPAAVANGMTAQADQIPGPPAESAPAPVRIQELIEADGAVRYVSR